MALLGVRLPIPGVFVPLGSSLSPHKVSLQRLDAVGASYHWTGRHRAWDPDFVWMWKVEAANWKVEAAN